MKKTILTAAICLLCCGIASYAQERVFAHKHRISFSYGDGEIYKSEVHRAINKKIILFPTIPAFDKGYDGINVWNQTKNIGGSGLITFGYEYFIPNEIFSIGSKLSYYKVFEKANPQNCYDFGIATAVASIYYKSFKHIWLSGSLELGVAFVDWYPFAVFNVTPLTFNFGCDRFTGFVELSLGYRLLVSAGVSVGL